MTASAGCVKAVGGRYRPLVFVAHHGVYFSADTFIDAEGAVSHAQESIESEHSVYLKWHFHAIP